MSSVGTRKEQQAATRDALLHSAARLFRERGLEGTSVEEIAAEAGFTKGAFYANFRSKEELFLTMLDEKFGEEIERIDRALSGHGDPGEEARHAAADFGRYVFADSEWPVLYFQFAAQAARDEDFREELATRCRTMRERMVKILERWSADFPADPPIPLEDLAAMTDLMGTGYIVEHTIDPEIREELLPMMMGIFFLGCQAMAVGWVPPPKAGQDESAPEAAASRSRGAGR
jgi:AcrR family transcriptional regulator